MLIKFTLLISILFFGCTHSHAENKNTQHKFTSFNTLTNFEIQSLSMLSQAQKNDPDALLRLYSLASGNIRTEADFNKIHLTIDKFLDRHGKKIQQEPDFWRKGYQLNKAIHKFFYTSTSSDKKNNSNKSNYDWEQSQLSKIFSDGKFNCVSSTMLYTLLARFLDIDVNIIVLPSHVFVELILPDKRHIEVETTSANGYAWIHNKKFYQNKASQWYGQRGLQPSTYQDYQNRESISPFSLITRNIFNQHSAPNRMPDEDLFRMAEISALIDPTQEMPIPILSRHYGNIYSSTLKLSDKKIAHKRQIKLFDKTFNLFEDLEKNTKNTSRFKKDNIFSAYYAQAAEAYSRQYNFNLALAKTNDIIKIKFNLITPSGRNYKYITSTYKSAINNILERYSALNNKEEGIEFLNNIPKNLLTLEQIDRLNLDFFMAFIRHQWDQENWETVISLSKQAMHRLSTDKSKKHISGNMTTAYLIQASNIKKTGDWKTAQDVYIECGKALEKTQESRKKPLTKCAQALTELRENHQL